MTLAEPKYSIGQRKWIIKWERYYAPMRDIYWLCEAEITARVLEVSDSMFETKEQQGWRYFFAYEKYEVYEDRIFDSFEEANTAFVKLQAAQREKDQKDRLDLVEPFTDEAFSKKKRWWKS